MAKDLSPTHYMSVGAAAEMLIKAHGEINAGKQALLGQQSARRARSRKRFDFWAEVARKIAETSASV